MTRTRLLLLSVALAAAPLALAGDLSGLWKAKLRFGPDARGPLLIVRSGESYTADFNGRTLPVQAAGGELSFALPNDAGAFRGRMSGARITGHWWRSPLPTNSSRFVSPVTLEPDGANRWRGVVAPDEETFTFYLLLQPRADGTLAALLRNPERDVYGQAGIESLAVDGTMVKLLTKSGKSIAAGSYDPEADVITLAFPGRGGSYDFRREGDDSEFYPRGRHPAPYRYRAPPALGDGWAVASLEEERIDRGAVERFIQRMLELPMDAPDAIQSHGWLMARHGRLVLEEYFHGEHRDKLHDTRSASKSLTATVIGAAMQGGVPLSLTSGVYETFATPTDDPQKRSMTLEHLLTMSSGFFCDDTNENAPGNEEVMAEQTAEPDYYRYTLRVPQATPPGEKSVYCSASPNLALGMLGRATGRSPVEAFDRWVAAPLQIRNYSWILDPAGNPYGGGSVRLLPRDFLKLGQLMLDGGVWNGKRVLPAEFVRRASSPLYHLRNWYYGYLWWSTDFPYKDRTVRAFAALGAGGQTVYVVPELDLVVATTAANYSSGRLTRDSSTNLIPRFLLPAVRERNDDPNAPVVEREYKNEYGPSEDGSRVKPQG
ncbi:MAG TPA: serine hydrolase [Thermoanaerobaculia bacterium]